MNISNGNLGMLSLNKMDEKKNRHGTKKLRGFCFTCNNPDDDWKSDMEQLVTEQDLKYLVVGYELGEEKQTPHLQGYCELACRTRMGKVKAMCKIFARSHFEVRRGSPKEASDYCKKDGQFIEFGKLPTSNQGKRNDLVKLRELVAEGITDKLTLYAECDAAFRYPQAVSEYVRLSKKAKLTPLNLTLKPWQQALLSAVESDQTTANRIVRWYWDLRGATGKTTMARYLITNKGAFYCTGGKTADIAHAYDEQSIVVFDFARSLEEHINYQVIENIKNGLLFSGKYNSCMKIFDPPAVVCFANFEPDRNKLSADRWFIKNLD